MSGPTINRAGSSGDIWTPHVFAAAITVKFCPIAWDLAATLLSSKARYAGMHINKERDSLTVPWHQLEPVDGSKLLYLNPPFSHITPWAGKCVDESRLGAEILLLVPGSIGACWYRDWVHPFADVYSIGRLVFDNCFDRKTGLPVKTVYPKDLVLCHYHPLLHKLGPSQVIQFWDWKKEDV